MLRCRNQQTFTVRRGKSANAACVRADRYAITQVRGLFIAALTVLAAFGIAGCAGVPAPEAPAHDPAPVEAVPVEAAPMSRREAPGAAPPAHDAAAEPAPGAARPRVVLVLSERSAAYERIAGAIRDLLDEPPLYDLADRSLSAEDVFLQIADSPADAVIAIGLEAAEAAAAFSPVPVVYCQVFNFTAPGNAPAVMKGIAAIPPLSLQLKGWRELAPALSRVGMIVGPGHGDLLDEALLAVGEHGMRVDHRVAQSDRETLLLFRRMAPVIDGFWLFPDNRILSMAVLRQMLKLAERYRVQVAVFNPELLHLGAAVSTSAVDSDVAATAVQVAEALAAGEEVPRVTPLNDVEVRTRQPQPEGDQRSMPGRGPGSAMGGARQ